MVGRAKDRSIRALLEGYRERVAGEWRFSVAYAPASKRREPVLCRREEGEGLRKKLGGGMAVAFHPAGKPMTSPQFGAFLAANKDRGMSVTFVVGGPHGLDEPTLAACKERISLSQMTFPHEMAALMAAEQIYRAYAASSRPDYAK